MFLADFEILPRCVPALCSQRFTIGSLVPSPYHFELDVEEKNACASDEQETNNCHRIVPRYVSNWREYFPHGIFPVRMLVYEFPRESTSLRSAAINSSSGFAP